MPDPFATEPDAAAPVVRRIRGSRRVVRPGAPGTDPTPQDAADAVRAIEDTDVPRGTGSSDNNDARLKQDVPPHWG